jgi:transketolase
MIRSGRHVTVLATGLLVWEALEAAGLCKDRGIDVRVIDIHTIRPLDEGTLLQAARETGAVVTAEEHLVNCGLGAQVAQLISKNFPVPMEFVGIKDTYAESGKPAELFERYGLTARHIVSAIEQVLKKKR